ncbi:MAG: type II secretion system F family protein [Candidatus Nanoarchaeia archaeon]
MAGSDQSPFQYIFQTIYLTGLLVVGMLVFFIILFADSDVLIWLIIGTFVLAPFIYKFIFEIVYVKAKKLGRELDGDLLFISEYLLVLLESGFPLPNALEQLSKNKRPGGKFMERTLRDFKMGKDLEDTLEEAILYCPSDDLRTLIKRLKDSLSIGVNLETVLVNFVEESSEKKLIDIKGYSKKLNPIVMMYLVFGIVIPSLGVTFFILFAAISDMNPPILGLILIFLFLFLFMFQYFSYATLKFSKSTI